ncbi:peptide chain release factor 1 [Candidatus Karelsulcia muelleri]|uniref:PCRF domain-containing protein n=1 Tax=Candidatus Karelsulcia muelleri TaxID=336810 RepID=A0A3A1MLW9_9FLAO|nr:peptide chain release factor 1 [Candidatus Karelsulcia muelleri]RIU86554.1 PCRF domain-containing protein [Candidatus Karelsulcia muelleri]
MIIDKFLFKKIEVLKKRFYELSFLIIKPEIIHDKKKSVKLSKEYKIIYKIINYYNSYKENKKYLKEIESLIKLDSDKELLEFAIFEKKKNLLELEFLLNKIESLLKKNNNTKNNNTKNNNTKNNNTKNVLMELRAGTGGDEACIFVENIFRMYTMYFKELCWKYEILNMQQGTIKGYKEIIIEIQGKNVYGTLKFESGVHRVQRVPSTESQGRLHTSAITVAILPEEDYNNNLLINIVLSDLKRETFRASGAGGQHVNKTESAIRLTHIPTGIIAECQEERSQHKNYEKAMKVLRARIYQSELKIKNEKLSKERKSLISTGDRSAKIRTYNYPQGRVTDHRINKSIYYLDKFMNGKINEMITALKILEKENN